MSFYELFNRVDPAAAAGPLGVSRRQIIEQAAACRHFDLLVVGGGIHGACMAHVAAFNGLKVLLLERGDYASATSSRSSKMAHGGLRYLEMFDFAQVFEGIRAREDLFETARHIAYPWNFLVPVPRQQRFFKYKLGVGLWLYDLMVQDRRRRHRWVPGSEAAAEVLADSPLELSGCFLYTDGILDDARLTLEHVLAARQEGALCLNYAEVVSLQFKASGGVSVGWRDVLTGESHAAAAGLVINCAGPWVPQVGRVKPGPLAQRLRFSRGVHLLFSRPWNAPALFLPLGERGRYYFVWPHFAGTMVGTTEREVDEADPDPQPEEDEIEEILGRLAKDLPGSGLDRSSLHYSFAGIRTLPLRGRGGSTSRLSRRHVWSYSDGVLSLLGGKLTTAAATACDGLRLALKLAGVSRKVVPLKGRLLPGAAGIAEVEREFRAAVGARGLPDALAERALRRFGGRLRVFEQRAESWDVCSESCFAGEIELALQEEQAETLEDILRRRLQLEYLPGHGMRALPEIVRRLEKLRPEIDWSAQAESYCSRLDALHRLMKIGLVQPTE